MNRRDGLSCARISVTFDGTAVLRDVDLHLPGGTVTSLVGPSGGGKTTLLRVVAGLLEPDRGRILVGDRDLTAVPTHRRPIGMIFQQARLFPHLSAAENVGFALRTHRVGRRRRRERAAAVLEEVRATHLGDRDVHGLSGGERQRVALARALVADPRVLLLDEPLAAVDREGRADLRRTLREVLTARSTTALFVTHDRTEAAEIGDRIAVLLDGRIVQEGSPRTVFDRPRSAEVARLVGEADLLRLEVRAGRAELDGAGIDVPAADGPVTVAVRPENVAIDPRGRLRGRVLDVVDAGTHARVRLTLGDHVLHAHVHADSAPPPGREVGVRLRHWWALEDEVER